MYKDFILNDLVWAITSPPILAVPDERVEWYGSPFYESLGHQSGRWFDTIAQDPSRLHEVITAEKDKRLGNYFETLWKFWIEASERYELIDSGIQVIDDGETMGEFDIIVYDRYRDKTLHWELAVKFYLGVGDTYELSSWHGPSRNDRLDKKVDHLSKKQSRLYQQEIARRVLSEKGISIDESAVIMKGRLFYPIDSREHATPKYSAVDHCRGRWAYASKFLSEEDKQTFIPLIKTGWMAGVDDKLHSSGMTVSQLRRLIEAKEVRLPLLLQVTNQAGERSRVFIVQDEWDTAV